MRRQLIFLPGLKGSRLVNDDNMTAWISAAVVLGLRTPQLKARQGPTLREAGPLESVALIRRIWEEDIYKSFLTLLRADERIDAHPWGYDWRLSPLTLVESLKTRLLTHAAEGRNTQIELVGHSLGGLLAWALAAELPGIVSRVTLVGTPLRGTLSFLPDLSWGSRQGLNNRVLSADVLGSFPTVACLFPWADGERDDPYEIPYWEARRLGPLSQGDPDSDGIEALRVSLSQARNFRARLASVELDDSIDVGIVRGSSKPTLAEPVFIDRRLRLEKSHFAAGDGRVVLEAALPPHGHRYALCESLFGHSALLRDPLVYDFVTRC
jgi:pimeloyl-ACP methyl ester carboxylesterase